MKRAAAVSACIVWFGIAVQAQSLSVRVERDQLRITAPRLHFLAGEALMRLHDGATVVYEFLLTARADKNGQVFAMAREQFAVSYDLWEEKYAVTRIGAQRRSVTHLSAAAAEVWCLDNLTLPMAGFKDPLWIRLDYKALDTVPARDAQDNSGLTLSGLIEVFSRRSRGDQVHGTEEIGPVRLDAIRKQ